MYSQHQGTRIFLNQTSSSDYIPYSSYRGVRRYFPLFSHQVVEAVKRCHTIPFIQGCSSNSPAVIRSSGLHFNMHLTNSKSSSFSLPTRFSSELSNVKPSGIGISAIQLPVTPFVSFGWSLGSMKSYLHHRRTLYSTIHAWAYLGAADRRLQLVLQDELSSDISS
jgi:hypothetical protein